MMKKFGLAILIVTACTGSVAQAETKQILQPLQIGNETVRFDRGNYLIDLVGQRAVVRVESMPSDHNNISFVVAVMNTGTQAVNVDTSNIHVEGTREDVRILTRADMETKVSHRAGWAKFFTGLGGAVAATALASQRDFYHATTVTPYGTVRTQFSTPCWDCRAAAADTLVATNVRIARIQGALDDARQALSEQTLQLTTVNPGQSYGGRIFLNGFKHEAMSQMRLVVDVGGESFTFAFRFAPQGTPTPNYRMAALPQSSAQPAPAVAYSRASPAFVAPTPVVYSAPARSGPGPVSATVAAQFGPAPLARKPPFTGANSAAAVKWHRYYETLIQSSISKHEAKLMADQEFGALD